VVARTEAHDVAIELHAASRERAEAWVDAVRAKLTAQLAPRSVWVAALMGGEHVARGRRAIAALLAKSAGVDHEPDREWPGVRLRRPDGSVQRVSIGWPGEGGLLLERG
jgi:hypothetical protein